MTWLALGSPYPAQHLAQGRRLAEPESPEPGPERAPWGEPNEKRDQHLLSARGRCWAGTSLRDLVSFVTIIYYLSYIHSCIYPQGQDTGRGTLHTVSVPLSFSNFTEIKSTYLTVDPVEVCDSVVFSIFRVARPSSHQGQNVFITPQNTLLPPNPAALSPCPAGPSPGWRESTFCPCGSARSGLFTSKESCPVVPRAWLLSLGLAPSVPPRGGRCSAWPVSRAEQCSLARTDHVLFFCGSVGGCGGCADVWAFVNHAAVIVAIRGFVSTCVFVSLGWTPRSGTVVFNRELYFCAETGGSGGRGGQTSPASSGPTICRLGGRVAATLAAPSQPLLVSDVGVRGPLPLCRGSVVLTWHTGLLAEYQSFSLG